VEIAGTATFAAPQQLAALTVTGAASLASGGGNVLDTGTLAITGGGTLDLSDNALLVRSGQAGTFDGNAYDGVQGLVQRAYNFGSWDQPGLTTSQQNAGPNAGPLSNTTTIGVATGEQILFVGAGETALFAGRTVTSTTVVAMYTYAGDMNFDGLIDVADYGSIDNWIQFPGTTGYMNGDLNYDGVIDVADYGVIDNSIQLQGAPFPPRTASPARAMTSADDDAPSDESDEDEFLL
jgi:hypothetical protein